MNLIQQEKDLQSFSDQALLQEAMQPTRGYAPYMVQTEISRRTKEREDYQKQMMAQQAQGAVPVAQQNVDRFVAQNMAAMQPPAQMPQGMGIASAVPAQMEAPAVDQAFMDAQASEGIAPLMAQSGMPVQGMSEGGGIRRMQQAGRTTPLASDYREAIANADPFTRALITGRPFKRSEAELRREIAALEQAGGDTSALKAELAAFKGPGIASVPSVSTTPTATPSTAPGIISAPGIASVAPRDITDMRSFIMSGQTAPDVQIRGIPVVRQQTQRREPRGESAVAAATTPTAVPASAAPQAAAQDTYYADLLKQMEGFKPSREEFDRERQAMLLANLGALVGGATRRGDIAAGIGQLVGQQIAAGKEFKKEEREALRDILAIRGQERAETREERRYQQNLKLEMDKIDIQRRQLAAETQYRMQAAANDAERNAIAREAAATDKLLIDTRKRLAEAQADYYKAQAEYYRSGKGDPFSNVRGGTSSAADLEAAGL